MSTYSFNELFHHGIKDQKWGIRRFQNPDGSLTEEGKKRYRKSSGKDFRNQMSITGSRAAFKKQYGRFDSRKASKMLSEDQNTNLKSLNTTYRQYAAKLRDGPWEDDSAFNRYGFGSGYNALSNYEKNANSLIREYGDVALDYIKRSSTSKEQLLAGKAMVEKYIESLQDSVYEDNEAGDWT